MQSHQAPAGSVCLFGGSFDPVHLGHLAIAKAARNRLDLDRVVFIPCRRSPHKGDIEPASAHHRLAMLGLTLGVLPWAEISAWEIDRPAPSWSWQTAGHFAGIEPPGTRLFWLLGADQWATLDTWARPDALARLVHFVVIPRADIGLKRRPGFAHTIIDVRHPAAATDVRAAIREGRSIDGLVSEAVRAYIDQNKLYRAPPTPAALD